MSALSERLWKRRDCACETTTVRSLAADRRTSPAEAEPLCSTGASDRLFFSPTLAFPTPFAAADVITRNDEGQIEFHYSILEV